MRITIRSVLLIMLASPQMAIALDAQGSAEAPFRNYSVLDGLTIDSV